VFALRDVAQLSQISHLFKHPGGVGIRLAIHGAESVDKAFVDQAKFQLETRRFVTSVFNARSANMMAMAQAELKRSP
jgi:hypothetical protein